MYLLHYVPVGVDHLKGQWKIILTIMPVEILGSHYSTMLSWESKTLRKCAGKQVEFYSAIDGLL